MVEHLAARTFGRRAEATGRAELAARRIVCGCEGSGRTRLALTLAAAIVEQAGAADEAVLTAACSLVGHAVSGRAIGAGAEPFFVAVLAVRARVAVRSGGEVGPEADCARLAVVCTAGERCTACRDGAAQGGELAEVANPMKDGRGGDHGILRAARVEEGAVGHQGVA